MKTIGDCRAYRLDETTDAGEFMLHAVEQAMPWRKPENADEYDSVTNLICEKDPTPEALAEKLTKDQLRRALGNLEAQWGDVDTVEFDSPRDRAIMTRGMESAQKFLSAALRIRQDSDRAVTS